MKAVTFKKYGPPEVLEISEVDTPIPSNTEVLIKVYATTLNRTDTGFRNASYFVSRAVTGWIKPKKTVTGTEFAGIIVSVGKDIKDYKVNDKVFGFDDAQFGSHAEFKCESSSGAMAKIPAGSSYYDVVAAGEGATYALNVLSAAEVRKDQKVLIYGASGAIGSAAVQIAKHLGAHVTAVCGTKNVKLLKSLGADRVINYQTENFSHLNDTFDMILDAVGKTSYGECKKMIRSNGTFISSEPGPWGQNIFLAIWFAVTRKRRVMFPIPKINKEVMEYIKQLLELGAFKPVIEKEYKLDEIVEASRYAESGQKTGSLVIRVI